MNINWNTIFLIFIISCSVTTVFGRKSEWHYVYSIDELCHVQSENDSISIDILFEIKSSDLEYIDASKYIFLLFEYSFPVELIHEAENLEFLIIRDKPKGIIDCSKLSTSLQTLHIGRGRKQPPIKICNIEALGEKCPKLTSIRVNRSIQGMLEEVLQITSLERLELIDLDLEEMNDLKNPIHINHLALLNCSKFDEVNTKVFMNIEALTISGMEINKEIFETVFPRLKFLAVSFEKEITPDVFNFNKNLKYLIIAGPDVDELDLNIDSLSVLGLIGMNVRRLELNKCSSELAIELHMSQIDDFRIKEKLDSSIAYIIYDKWSEFYGLESRVFWNLKGFTLYRSTSFLYDPRKIEVLYVRSLRNKSISELFPNMKELKHLPGLSFVDFQLLKILKDKKYDDFHTYKRL
jgi:hypothetical protein